MAKSAAAKSAAKKKNRKLKRQIRKTVGALLMVSAIAVAAVPVPDVKADPATDGHKIQVLNYAGAGTDNRVPLQDDTGSVTELVEARCGSYVPIIGDTDTIYTTGDQNYQFAFVRTRDSGDYVAVLLNARVGNLDGGKYTIPDKIDAYKKFNLNTSENGLCAVGQEGDYLYYPANRQQKDPATNEYLYFVPGVVDSSTPTGFKHVHRYSPGVEVDSSALHGYIYKHEKPGTDDEGNPITITERIAIVPYTVPGYAPCYYESIDEWKSLGDENLYYYTGTGEPDLTDATKFELVGSLNRYKRIHDTAVRYIGSQYVEQVSNAAFGQSDWKLGASGGMVTEANASRGVFAGKNNIVTLEIKDNTLYGVGDYAFYGCGGLNSISFADGLNTIGNGAFQNCNNLVSCNMELTSILPVIGKRAFSGCTSLKKITIPIGVVAIGDYCFENCSKLEEIDLCGGEQQLEVQLQAIGYNAFVGCSSLASVTFPVGYRDFEKGTENDEGGNDVEVTGIPIKYFSGCTSLQSIKVQNNDFTFIETNHIDDLNCDIGNFLKNGQEGFFFEGPAPTSAIYRTSKNHSAAFKYLDEDRFEKTIWCPEREYNDNGSVKEEGHRATFAVDSSNRLIDMEIDEDCGIVEIPANIGAGHGIETIGSSGFRDNCSLIKITIPPTVKTIESDAFRGCHALRHVLFTEPNQMESIGPGAFITQAVGTHGDNCQDKNITQPPELSFTGAISPDSVPFDYAMNPANTINSGNQEDTYITFYSGWPTNLTVKYNPETDKNELINYPKHEDLSKYEAWTKTGGTQGAITYPDLTEEYAEAANNVGANASTGTPVEQAISNSTINITLPAGIESIKEDLFKKNEKLESIAMETVEELEDYAFDECKNLASVTISGILSEMGIRPFRDCEKLTGVNFPDTTNFSCENGIIFGMSGGNKSSIVQCLETRGKGVGYYTVEAGELKGVTSIQKEAFMDCLEIGEIDLSESSVQTIPERCFKNTAGVTKIALPSTVNIIELEAFKDTGRLKVVHIPSNQMTYMADDVFQNGDWRNTPEDRLKDPGNTGQQEIYLECVEGSYVDRYAKQYWYLTPEYGKVSLLHNVYFWNYPDYSDVSEGEPVLYEQAKVPHGEDAPLPSTNPKANNPTYTFKRWSDSYKNIVKDDTDVYAIYGDRVWKVIFFSDGKTYKTEMVEEGKSATPPEEIPEREGYTFREWDDYRSIGVGLDFEENEGTVWIMAQFDNNFADENLCTVKFDLFDGRTNTMSTISTQTVPKGGAATPPAVDVPSGYTFTGWSGDVTKIESDMTFVGSLVRGGSGPNPSGGSGPNPSGGNGNGNNPNPSGGNGNNGNNNNANSSSSPKNSATPTATPADGKDVPKYTVTVSGGSGTGSYPAGAVVAINAYAMGVGQVFDKWTSSTAGVGFADATATSTTFTMPAANVAITATYKTGGAGNAATNSSGGSGGGGGSSTGTVNNGSTVEVSKPGISNTNVAGATVTGATDNFVVKVSEDQAATDAATSALQARFGDLSRIKYFPMDISLYDSTGRTKIADTSGISVNLTLPLPDELIQYAGNNKMAAISGGALEDLNARFTTVGGVPCINFTATHFSPYVIYVDTANLTEATIDSTPKTGDPIHPKWFLAIGMACISLVLFFKRDKVVVKTKAA